MKPLLSYYGGKQRLASKIVPLISDHKVYVEPFCGGAAIFFAKPTIDKAYYVEVLNDNQDELISFYITASMNPQKFIKTLSFFPYSESIFRFFRKNKDKIKSKLLQAVGYYIRIMQSFGFFFDSSFRFCKTFNSSKAYHNRKKSIEEKLERLQKVCFHCRDALEIIKLYDSEDTFFYIDPPYFNTDCGSYGEYLKEQYEKLINTLKNIKGKFILSSYDNIKVDKQWFKKEYNVFESCNAKIKGKENNKRVECLWMNYNPNETLLFDEQQYKFKIS